MAIPPLLATDGFSERLFLEAHNNSFCFSAVAPKWLFRE
jgi:hypothetical protein